MNPQSAQIMRSRLSPSGTPRTEGPRPVSASAITAGIIGTGPGRDKKAGPGFVTPSPPLGAERDVPAAGLSRRRNGALVVHDLADTGAVLVGEARRVGRQVGSGRHAALHRRPLADLVEP